MKEKVLEAFNRRYACKLFDKTKKISNEDFNFILETGRLSPSSFGFEPWKFVVLQDQEKRNALKAHGWGAADKLDTASHFVIILARKPVHTKYGSDYVTDIMRNVQKLPENVVEMKGSFYKDFQTRDFNLTTDEKLQDWASKQTYIALGNMMTAASLIGIDSCPIEGFHLDKTREILKEFGILDTESYDISVMVAFGYRDESRPIPEKTRQSLDDIVSYY